MRSIIIALTFVFTAFKGYSQDITKLDLNSHGKDLYFEKSKLIAPVFKLKNHTIEGYEKFGVKSETVPEKHAIKLPEIIAANDTGYTFLYSGVNPRNKTGYTPVVVLNYSRRMKPAILLVDHNLNYDFTDDGDPDTFYLNLPHLEIELRNQENPSQAIRVRVGRFDFTREYAFKKMVDEFYNRYSGSKEYVGTDFSFREQRFNIRYQDYGYGNDSFRVALADMNYNGLYNEAGTDKIYIDQAHTEIIGNDHMFEITPQLKNCYFERHFKSYKVIGLDSFGRSITFFIDSSQVALRQLLEGEKVPKMVFEDAAGKKTKLNSFRRMPVYIFFWNRESPTFDEDTAALRIMQEKYCSVIKIIALNYGDNPKSIRSFVEVNRICWLNGIATKKIIQQFRLEEVPYGMLLKKRRRLYQKGLRPAEILAMLERGEIQSW